ncbi:SIS domain-containing protein [Nitrosopumilus sp.]|nr:SIS domain-containing protein [Nitrosopumilus sp.]
MEENNKISKLIEESIIPILKCKEISNEIKQVKDIIIDALKNKNKIILFGNGGSAADSQHMAAEFIGRFLVDRQSIPAISLTTDTSILTAVGNDFGFKNIFSRQCESLVSKGDIIIAISTSGNSSNVINGIKTAKERGGIIISLTGNNGGELNNISDKILKVPTEHIPHIQECHRVIIHILCDLIEKELMNDLN